MNPSQVVYRLLVAGYPYPKKVPSQFPEYHSMALRLQLANTVMSPASGSGAWWRARRFHHICPSLSYSFHMHVVSTNKSLPSIYPPIYPHIFSYLPTCSSTFQLSSVNGFSHLETLYEEHQHFTFLGVNGFAHLKEAVGISGRCGQGSDS